MLNVKDKKMGNGTYSSEDIEVTFSADMERCDYGVARSPVWYEATDIVIDSLEICGCKVDPKDLPADLVKAIIELADYVDFDGEG